MKKPAFDGVASEYDARFSHQVIAEFLRRKVQNVADQYLDGSSHVLEVGCGTGQDARYFAEQGHVVMATDASQAMLDIAEAGAITTALWDVSTPIPPKVLDGAAYDLVFANFGVMNCVEDLSQFSQKISKIIKPHGVLVLVFMNRWCGMELLLNLILFNTKNMLRRLKRDTIATLEDGSCLRVWYPSIRSVRCALAPEFSFSMHEPIGVFLPPSELYGMFQKRPRLLRFAKMLDSTLGKVYPISHLSDHSLLVFQRETT